MRTPFCIQAGLGNHQSLYRQVADDVRFNDFVHIIRRDSAIPDCLRIDHNRRPVLTLIKTAGFVGADRSFNALLGQFDLEDALQVALAGRIAAPARISIRPLIATNEDVFFEFWHGPD